MSVLLFNCFRFASLYALTGTDVLLGLCLLLSSLCWAGAKELEGVSKNQDSCRLFCLFALGEERHGSYGGDGKRVKSMGHGKKTSKGQEKITPFSSVLLCSDSSVISCFDGSIYMVAYAMLFMQSAVRTSHRRLRYGCFSAVSRIQGRLATKPVSGGSAAKEALFLQKRDCQGSVGLSHSSVLCKLHPGCRGGEGVIGHLFFPKKTSCVGVSGSVQGEDPSNNLLKAFNLALEWSPNWNQCRDQTVSYYATVFFFYFNTSGSSEICALSMQFCGPANDSNNSQCIQRQQAKLPLIACLLSAHTVSQNHFIIMTIILF